MRPVLFRSRGGYRVFRLGDFSPQEQHAVVTAIAAGKTAKVEGAAQITVVDHTRGRFHVQPTLSTLVSPFVPIAYDSTRLTLRQVLRAISSLFDQKDDLMVRRSTAPLPSGLRVLNPVCIDTVGNLGAVVSLSHQQRVATGGSSSGGAARTVDSGMRAVFVGLQRFAVLQGLDGRAGAVSTVARMFPAAMRAHVVSIGRTGVAVVLQPVVDPVSDIPHLREGPLLRASSSPVVQALTAALYLRQRTVAPMTALSLAHDAAHTVVMPYLVHGRAGSKFQHHPLSLPRLASELQWQHFAGDYGGIENIVAMKDVWVFGAMPYVMPLAEAYVRLTLLPRMAVFVAERGAELSVPVPVKAKKQQGVGAGGPVEVDGFNAAVPLLDFFAWLWDAPKRKERAANGASALDTLASLTVEDLYPVEPLEGKEMAGLHADALAKYVLRFPRLLDLRLVKAPGEEEGTLWIWFRQVGAARMI